MSVRVPVVRPWGWVTEGCSLPRLLRELELGLEQTDKIPKEIVNALLLPGSLIGLKWVAESALLCWLPFAHFI